MLSPELSLEEIEAQISAARGEVAGATHALDESQQHMENARRELDERTTAKANAVRKLDDLGEILRLRRGVTHEVVAMRREIGELWLSVAAVEEGEDDGLLSPADKRRADFLAQELRRLCPHPHLIAYVNDPRINAQQRECVICGKREAACWDKASLQMELRDLPGRTVLVLTAEDFTVIACEFADLPGCDAIGKVFARLAFGMKMAEAAQVV